VPGRVRLGDGSGCSRGGIDADPWVGLPRRHQADSPFEPDPVLHPEEGPGRAAMSVALLEVRDLALAYGDVQVLFGVSLRVEEGEIVTLLGSNGAGKTTTLRAISGLRPARGGDIRYRGESLLGIAASERAELGIALVPEGRELWPQLTVRENLELGAYSKGARPRSGQNIE